MRFAILSFTLLFSAHLIAQKSFISFLDSGRNVSLRGLCAVDSNIVWASGSNGTVARSINGGKSFDWLSVKGYEQREFRDIEAFDENTAVIMAIAEPAVILRTKDGGRTWKEVFRDQTKGMFLDAMDFDSDGNGIVVGDPVNYKIFIATTGDYGKHWKTLKAEENNYTIAEGEAMFASSGTNIKLYGSGNAHRIFIVTGGKSSRLFLNSYPVELPIQQGAESQGANSIAVNLAANKIVAVGGDFNNPASSFKNCVSLSEKNNQWLTTVSVSPPSGYRSCVEFITYDEVICCGITGVDISNDSGLNWKKISNESFHVCQKAKKGNAVFLAGSNGRIAKLSLE